MATLAARVHEMSPWRSVIRAMTQTGGSSLLSGLLSMTATKIIAVAAGPAQVALLATLQQVRTTGVNGATLVGQTALVQGASALQGAARGEFVRTVALLMSFATATVTIPLALAPGWVARQSGVPANEAWLLTGLAPVVVISAVFVFLAALLNSTGAIASLASVQMVAPAAMALLAYSASRAVSSGRVEAFLWLLAASSTLGAAAAGLALWRKRDVVREWFHGAGAWFSAAAARRFFAVSGSMFISGLFSSWVLMKVRGGILESEGLVTGGKFDAAWAISMNQAGLVLASLQSYYLPSLARSSDSAERSAHIRRVLTVAAAISAVLIGLLTALKPLVVTALYSEEFTGAARYLRWTLAGDYLKITSWILSIPLIAVAHMRAFLMADLSAFASFAVAAWVLRRWLGAAEGAAAAFVIMYAVHLGFCGAYLWNQYLFRPDLPTAAAWAVGLGLVVTASGVFWT